jgi:hypothetical protein
MIFEGADGFFCSVSSMDVWGNELILDVLLQLHIHGCRICQWRVDNVGAGRGKCVPVVFRLVHRESLVVPCVWQFGVPVYIESGPWT